MNIVCRRQIIHTIKRSESTHVGAVHVSRHEKGGQHHLCKSHSHDLYIKNRSTVYAICPRRLSGYKKIRIQKNRDWPAPHHDEYPDKKKGMMYLRRYCRYQRHVNRLSTSTTLQKAKSSAANQRQTVMAGPGLADFIRQSQHQHQADDVDDTPRLMHGASAVHVPSNVTVFADLDISSKSFHIETYGCQMNSSDSEIVRAILLQHGYDTYINATYN